MVRVQITIKEELLKKVDEHAKSAGLSRSGFMSLAASDYISAKEKAPKVSEAFVRMATLIDQRMNGAITKEELETKLDEVGKTVSDLQK